MTSSANFTTINPATLETLKSYSYSDQKKIEKTLELAHLNQKLWRLSSVDERKKYLLSVAQNLKSYKDKLVEAMALEMGKPLAEGNAEILKCIQTCEYYYDQLDAYLAQEEIAAHMRKNWVQVDSLGVILGIMPWNFPVWQVIRFAIPALSLGNTVILKHSDITAGCAEIIEKVFERVSETQIYFNLPMTHENCAHVISDHRISAVSLTGSLGAGRIVAAHAGAYLKKSVLELGGSDAYFLLEDADLRSVIPICAKARLINNGQSCVSAKRFFVPQKHLSEFIDGIEAEVKKIKIGSPFDLHNQLGPLAHLRFKNDLEKKINDFKPSALFCKQTHSGVGAAAFVSPEIMSLKIDDSRAHQVEMFGPVFFVFGYTTETEAIHWIHESPYALGGAVFSRDEERALDVAQNRMHVGMVTVNDSVKSDPRMPFGGLKNSGYGRELGRFGFYEFANIKSVGLS